MRKTTIGLVTAVAMATAMLIGIAAPAHAATAWFVRTGGLATNNCTSAATACPTITAVMAKGAAVVNGDTIDVGSGTFTEHPTINKAVTVTGAGPTNTIINAASTAALGFSTITVQPASNTDNVLIQGLRITGGFSKFGGGVSLISGNLTLNNVDITGNTAGGITGSTGGGAIATLGRGFGTAQTLTITGSTISGNKTVPFDNATTSTVYPGGAIYLLSPATISGTTFTNNTVTPATTGKTAAGTNGGGGIYVTKFNATLDTPSLDLASSTISGSSAAAGGAIFANSSAPVTVRNGSALSGNNAVSGGGILTIGPSVVTLNSSSLSSNAATFQGGGLYMQVAASGDVPTLNATSTNFTSNTAPSAGGGAVLYPGSLANISGGTFQSNSSPLGAALFVTKGATANTNGTAFTSNTATALANTAAAPTGGNNTGWGGAIYNAGALNVTGGSFATNIATGIPSSLPSGSTAPINAGNGGAIVSDGALSVVGGTTFTGNRAIATTTAGSTVTSWGGAIYLGPIAAADAPTATVNDATFNGGSVANAVVGGAIVAAGNVFSVTGTTPPVLNGARDTFTGMLATYGGGLFQHSGSATLTDSAFNSSAPSTANGGGLVVWATIASDNPVVNLTNSTFTGNTTSSTGGAASLITKGTLNLTGSTLDGNTSFWGGGIYAGDGTTVNVDTSTIKNNTAASGVTLNGGDGGGVLNAGTLNVTKSTLSGNKATAATVAGSSPRGTGFGGAIYSGSTVNNAVVKTTIDSSTMSGNSANTGSALINWTSSGTTGQTNSVAITNSTVSNNFTTTGSGSIVTGFPVSIVSSTIANNTANTTGQFGAMYLVPGSRIAGSIVSANTVAGCGIASPTWVAPTDGGYNQSDPGDNTCGFTAAKNDISALPQLGALANNGGPTQTRLPGNSSPLINVIPVSTATGITNAVTGGAITLCAPGGTDQRGSTRPSGDRCDIGSVEVTSVAPTLSGPASDSVTVGSAMSDSFTATGVPTPKLTKTGALPAGVTFTDNGNGTATIAGTPASGTGGTYPVTIKAANGASPDATLSFTLTVNEGPTLTGPSSDTYTVGTPGGPDTFVSTSSPTATLTKTGALPAGVTFTDNGNGTATIAGTPAATTGGVYVVTVKASNGIGTDATKTFTLTVKEAPSISGATSLTYTAGTAIPAQTYAIVGYPAPTLTKTGLPNGLTLTNNGDGTATLAGTPAAGSGGVHNAVFTVTNTVGVGTLNVTITVNEAPQISGPTSRGCAVGVPCGPDTFSASGYPPSAFGYTGTLPSGITFTDNGNGTATIGGTAAAGSGGVYAITITATNVAGSAIYSYTLTIGQPPTVAGPANGVFVVGTPGAPLTYTTTGFPTPALTATGLPAGLTFTDNGDGTGTLGGTAAAGTGGSYTAVVHATNGVGSEATMNVTLVVNEAPGISGPATRNCVVSNPCGPDTFTATGNPTPTLASFGSLPAGVTFADNGNGTATIGGTPAANSGGTYSLSIVATNAYGTATMTYTLTVGQPPTVTGPSTGTYTVGSAGASLGYTTTGYPAPSLSASGLPAGVTLTDNGNGTASINGTPAAGTGGVHLVVITADNGVGTPATTGLTLTVNEAPQVTGPTSATYVVGFAGTPQTFTTTVGYPAATMSEIGALPAGVTFTDNGNGSATLNGTPGAHTGGVYPITVKAANGSGTSIWAFTLTVNEAPTVSGPTSARFDIDSPGSVDFTTTGFPQAGLTLEGDLPSGVGFYDNADGTGTIAGTPDSGTEGVYVVKITADNGVSPSASMTFTLTVVAPVIVTTGDLTDAAVGTPYSQQLTATGGVPPYTWSLVGGALPAGLTLSPSGVISGSPTAPAATSTFTVRAQDSLTPVHAGTKQLTLVVRKGATTLTVAPAVLKISALQPTLLTVSATLTGPTKQPLPNQSITFFAGQSKICVAVTDATGKAGCSVVVKEISTVLHLGNRASYYGSQYWQPANGAGGVIG